jgi:hypothetical protein
MQEEVNQLCVQGGRGGGLAEISSILIYQYLPVWRNGGAPSAAIYPLMCGRLTKDGSDVSVFVYALSRGGTQHLAPAAQQVDRYTADSRDNWATAALLTEVVKLNCLEPRRPSSLTL